jgi:RimJ/RimL family protein N-acetyltransferase
MAAILETPRLALREMTEDDLDFVAAMLADPEVMRYYPKCLDRDESLAWVRRQLDRYESHGIGLWLALDRASDRPVGQIGLIPPRAIPGAEEVEIGYLVHRPFWRQGYASEGAAACRDYTFDALDRPRVICLVRPVNAPSRAVARKIGLADSGLRVELVGFEHIVYHAERADF